MTLTKRARELRANVTEAEKRMWKHLRNRQLQGYKFYRQYPIPPYYMDFVCRDAGLIIELDGGQHDEQKNYDDRRTRFLNGKGYKVLRFWNNEVLGNTEGVMSEIERQLEALTPALSLKGEGEVVLPTPEMERWKYTNLAPAVKAMPGAVSPAPVSIQNGEKLVQRLGNVFPAGAPAWLAALGRDDPRGGSMALWRLGAAQQNDGIMIDVPAGKTVEKPVEMLVQGADDTFFIPRTVIRLGAGARLMLIEKHNGNGRHWNNSVMEIAVGAGAVLNHIRLQENGTEAVYTQNTHVRVEGGGRYDAFTLTTGSLLSRNEILVELAGREASCRLHGVNLLDGKQHGDTTITVAHMAPDCRSNQFYRSILKGQAHGVFQGKIHVHRGAQGTDGYQLSNTILLSEGAEMDTKPELEIYADDVKCSHGATTGALDEEAMFYMRSRGLGETEARSVLLSAFVNDTVDKFGDEVTKPLLQERIQLWLSDENPPSRLREGGHRREG